MGTNFAIGYERLLELFKDAQTNSPKGVGLKRKGSGSNQRIYLRFKVGNKDRKPYACNCTFSLDGIASASKKANLVAEKLASCTSEIEFWEWYDREIKEISNIKNDILTFGEAIIQIENDFFNGYRLFKKPPEKRDRKHPSDNNSWETVYLRYYQYLPQNKQINLKDIQEVLSRWEQGSKSYKDAVSVMKKLARTAKRKDILDDLEDLNSKQTKFRKKQTIGLDEFLEWRDKALGITEELHPNANLDTRKKWLWVFSMCIQYGMRISEVFAIKNLYERYTNKELNIDIPAYNDPNNEGNIIYIGKKTILGTTVKTGDRFSRLIIPPSYPNLTEKLDTLNPKLPDNKPGKNSKVRTIANFISGKARNYLVEWNAPFTQTHADRHLCNLLGMQAGIKQEIRSQSLGHTPQSNQNSYKSAQSIQTQLDVLRYSNQDAIDFVAALNLGKKLVKRYPGSYQPIAELLARIYGKNEDDVMNLL